MPKIILLNHVMSDGIGDFFHCLDIYKELSQNEKFRELEFIPVICCQEEQLSKIKKELETAKVRHYFIGTTNDYRDKFRQPLQTVFNEADQVIQISHYSNFICNALYKINPHALLKFIGEHENALYLHPFNEFESSHIVKLRSMGLSKGHFGIKIKSIPSQATRLETSNLFDHVEMTESETEFKKKLLAHSHSGDMSEFNQKNLLYPAYFNLKDGFVRFLLFLSLNKKMKERKKDIAIYLSGQHIDSDDLRSFSFDFANFDQTDIKQIELIESGNNNPPLTHVIHENGARTIRIFYGFHLEDKLYNAVYQQASIVGVSGDNTFEKAVSYKILPYYSSTNFVMKRKLLLTLSNIIRDEIDFLPETTKNNFILYFKDLFAFSNFYPRIVAVDAMSFEQMIPIVAELDLEDMAIYWPRIASYLFDHYNFYNTLEDFFLEGYDLPRISPLPHPPNELQGIESGGNQHSIQLVIPLKKMCEKDDLSSQINMKTLCAFIAILGIAAVAVALVVIQPATVGTACLIVTGAGLATALVGYGFFRIVQNHKNVDDDLMLAKGGSCCIVGE